MTLEEEWGRKEALKKAIRKCSDQMLAEAYGGICEGDKLRDIHKRIVGIAKSWVKRGYEIPKKAVAHASSLAKEGKRRCAGLSPADFPLVAFNLIARDKAFQESQRIVNEQARKKEGEWKEQILRESVIAARPENAPKNEEKGFLNADDAEKKGESKARYQSRARMFYVVSRHGDCAEDHLDYQGRVYYEKNFRRYVTDPDLRAQVETYIQMHGLLSWQYITLRPVWLVSRPNCRHYFAQLSISRVLKEDNPNDLCQKLGMSHAKGKKSMQPVWHEIDRGWYTRSNVEGIIAKYKERYAYHKELYRKKPSPEIAALLRKDEYMIAKWEGFLRNNF